MSGSVLDRYEQMPEWRSWRAANIARFVKEHGAAGELQALIYFAHLVDNGRLKAPEPANRDAPAKRKLPRPPKGYATYAAVLKGFDLFRAVLKKECLTPLANRVVALEKQLGELKSGTGDKALIDRVQSLEAIISELKHRGELSYRGPWKEGEAYSPGAFVTFAGSMWHANESNASVKPGSSPVWTLAVKRGRDGKKRHDDDAEHFQAGTPNDTRKVSA